MNTDYDDMLSQFKKCVTSITLKSAPSELFEECLSAAEIAIKVETSPIKRPGPAQPWLCVEDLDALSWARNILEGELMSDCLLGSNGLFNLTAVEELTIWIEGDNFDDEDLHTFQNAIENLQKLKKIRILVKSDVLPFAKSHFVWTRPGLVHEVATTGGGPR